MSFNKLLAPAFVIIGLGTIADRALADNLADFTTCVASATGPQWNGTTHTCTLPYATYTVSAQITVSSAAVRFISTGSSGTAQTSPQATLQRSSPTSTIQILHVQSPAFNVTVENLIFDGSSDTATSGGELQVNGTGFNSGPMTIKNCTFKNSSTYAVNIEAPNVYFSGNTFGPGVSTGIKIGTNGGPFYIADNNKFTGYPGSAISSNANVSGIGSTIKGNTVTRNAWGARPFGGGQIYLAPGLNVSLLNNTIDGQWSYDPNEHSYGLEIEAGSSSVYSFGNQIRNNGVDGIYVNGVQPVAIEGDTISNNATSGIAFPNPVGGVGVSIFGVSSTNNGAQMMHNSGYPGPWPGLGGYGLIIQNAVGSSNGVCVQAGSSLSPNQYGQYGPPSPAPITYPFPSACSSPIFGTIYPVNSIGSTQIFTSLVHIGGSGGYQNIQFVQLFFSSLYPINSTTSCHLEYVRSTNTLYVDANNGGNNWVAHAPIGSGGGVIGNSQCQVNTALSSVTASGAHLMLNLDVTFLLGFGSNPIYIYQSETDNSNNTTNWLYFGTWIP